MRANRGKKDSGTEGKRGPDAKELLAPSPRSPDDVAKEMVSEEPVLRQNATVDDPSLAWEGEHPDHNSRFGRIRGFQQQGGSMVPSNSHRGRASSWVAVLLACAGFVVGGTAIALGSPLLLLAISGLLLAAALVVAFLFDLFSDVVLDTPRVDPEEPHDTPLHRIKHEGPST